MSGKRDAGKCSTVQLVTVTLLISMTLILVIETCVFVSKLQFQVCHNFDFI